MVRALEVHLYGDHLGTVHQDLRGRVSFAYEQTAGIVPLSLSMPISATEHPPSKIVPFLENLLPDSEDVRDGWARRFGVSPRNAFALLAHMGRDVAGAAQFRNHDQLEIGRGANPVTEEDIARRLRDLTSDPAGWVVSGERWSLAGAQSKFTLAQDVEGQWRETRGSTPSTHIIKPGIGEYRHQALVEHVSMGAARAIGLRAAKTEFREFAGESALVVTRFDRRRARDGSVVRVHQEDMCQALAVYPRRKYEGSGGPSAAKIAQLLRGNATDGESDVWEFARALVFNYLIGAPDAHAKNYSVMHVPGLTRLSPLYDVASALPYDAVGDSEIDQTAMSIGGRRKFGTVYGRHWDRLAGQLKIDAGRLRDEISRQAQVIPPAFASRLEPFSVPDLAARLLPRLEQLCAATVTKLRD